MEQRNIMMRSNVGIALWGILAALGLVPSTLGLVADSDGVIKNPAYAQWWHRQQSADAAGEEEERLDKLDVVASYSNSKHLPYVDENGNDSIVALHWKVNNDTNKINIALAVEAEGWIAIGFTEMGGMPGADMVIFKRSSKKLLDAHSVAYERPKIDKQQDWTLLNSIAEDGMIMFEAERDLDTGDPMDWPFEDDSSLFKTGTKIIAAWGDTEEMHYHNPKNRLQGEIRFYADSASVSDKDMFDNIVHKEGEEGEEGSISVRLSNFTVPHALETWYEWKCITVADLVKEQGLPDDKPVHLIGFEMDLDPGLLLHHIVLYYDTRDSISKCDPWHSATSIMLGWGRGQSKTFLFPKNIGILLADESERGGKGLGMRPKSFRLELHYENPKRIKGLKDSSGIRLHYTTKLREFTAGTLEVGDPQVKMRGKPIGEGLRQHTFGCPESCTESHLPPQGVTVFYQLLHMHRKGLTMEIAHQRNGEDINTAKVQYFDAKFGNHLVERQLTILPGDTFQTRCTYESTKDDKLQFGFEARREMCLGTIYYYPASVSAHMMCTIDSGVKECVASHSASSLSGASSLNRTFGLESPNSDISSINLITMDSAIHSLSPPAEYHTEKQNNLLKEGGATKGPQTNLALDATSSAATAKGDAFMFTDYIFPGIAFLSCALFVFCLKNWYQRNAMFKKKKAKNGTHYDVIADDEMPTEICASSLDFNWGQRTTDNQSVRYRKNVNASSSSNN